MSLKGKKAYVLGAYHVAFGGRVGWRVLEFYASPVGLGNHMNNSGCTIDGISWWLVLFCLFLLVVV